MPFFLRSAMEGRPIGSTVLITFRNSCSNHHHNMATSQNLQRVLRHESVDLDDHTIDLTAAWRLCMFPRAFAKTVCFCDINCNWWTDEPEYWRCGKVMLCYVMFPRPFVKIVWRFLSFCDIWRQAVIDELISQRIKGAGRSYYIFPQDVCQKGVIFVFLWHLWRKLWSMKYWSGAGDMHQLTSQLHEGYACFLGRLPKLCVFVT